MHVPSTRRQIRSPLILICAAVIFLLCCIWLLSRQKCNTVSTPSAAAMEAAQDTSNIVDHLIEGATLKETSLLRLRACLVLELHYSRLVPSSKFNTDKLNKCIRNYLRLSDGSFERFHMGRFGEIKYFLPLSRNFTESDCRWLTIGIGGDDNVEKEFKEKYSECLLYGIEPNKKDHAGFSKYGTVIPHAVGTSNINGYIYETAMLKIEPLSKLLDTYAKSRFIHYASLDIEGFEYTLLRSMQKGGTIHRENVVICQMDVELHSHHGGSLVSSNFDLSDFLKEFFLRSPYTPVLFSHFLSHVKMTAIRTDVPECREAFDWDRYV
uniref:Methyltransf_21 domain-containing protein n=1 Tax=Steinernema glaseri TaxID=37863 RepID=A0A1I7XX51_9BILA